MKRILAVINDFLLSVKTDTILKNHGHKLEYLNDKTDIDEYDILLVDLSDNRAFEIIKLHPNKCIAFGSHIDINLLNKAKELGCYKVLARSKFFIDLPNLIKEI
jgi:hypothetical protein